MMPFLLQYRDLSGGPLTLPYNPSIKGGTPMKRLLALLFAALILVSLLPGCTVGGPGAYVPTGSGLSHDDPTESVQPTDPTEEDELELSMVYNISASGNPFQCTDPSNRAWMSLIYQGLFAGDSNYEAWPILCANYWVSTDMMTWTFYIHNNVTFSDGTPLTVEDVLASLEYAMQSDMYRGRFGQVRSLYLSTDGAITFKLHNPYENFPILLDVPILKATQLDHASPVGTGPYRLNTTVAGLRLVRRTDWWSNAELPVNASSITLVAETDPVAIRDDFELGQIQISCADPSDRNYAPYRSDYELWDCENGEFLYLACNLDSWLFETTAIRSVLTHAIDREAIVDEFYNGLAHPATLAASPLSPYYDTVMAARYEYDPEIFIQRVDEAKVAYNTVVLLVNGGDPQRIRIAQRIKEMLEPSGLIVEIETWTGLEYRWKLNIGDYDLHLGKTKLSATMDLSPFFSSSGALSFGSLSNTALYTLCLDSLANRGNYYNLLQEIAEDGRLVPILFGSYTVYGQRGTVTDLAPARDNVFFYHLGTSLADIALDAEPSTTPRPVPTEPEE